MGNLVTSWATGNCLLLNLDSATRSWLVC